MTPQTARATRSEERTTKQAPRERRMLSLRHNLATKGIASAGQEGLSLAAGATDLRLERKEDAEEQTSKNMHASRARQKSNLHEHVLGQRDSHRGGPRFL